MRRPSPVARAGGWGKARRRGAGFVSRLWYLVTRGARRVAGRSSFGGLRSCLVSGIWYLGLGAVGYNLVLFRNQSQRRTGLDLIARGFRRELSPVLMQMLLYAARQSPELRPQVDQVCTEYVTDFETGKEQYAAQDGYILRLEAARLALIRLKEVAEAQANADIAEALANRESRYVVERDTLARRKRW